MMEERTCLIEPDNGEDNEKVMRSKYKFKYINKWWFDENRKRKGRENKGEGGENWLN